MARVQKETQFLVSSAGTGYVYVHRKNKKKFKGEKKLALVKFDPIARKHVRFDESSKQKTLKRSKGKAPAKTEGAAEAPKA
jgi:ribosomal protein L33